MKPLPTDLKREFFGKLFSKLNRDEIDAILGYMDNDSVHTYSKYLGAGSYGAVFKAKDSNDQESAMKFQMDDNRYSGCNDAWNSYSKVVQGHEEDRYVIGMKKPVKMRNGSIYFCVFEMESGITTNRSLLQKYQTPSQEEKNSKFLLSLFKKIIVAFGHFNFDYGYYHADIKLDNLVYVEEADGSIGVRIIDFDLTFKDPKKVCEDKGIDYYTSSRSKQCNPSYPVYTLGFRAPELKRIIPDTNWSRDDIVMEKSNWANYRWDRDFKEEAYAVGQTLNQILKNHEGCYDGDTKYGDLIEKIASGLAESRIDRRWSLPEMLKYIERKEQELGLRRII